MSSKLNPPRPPHGERLLITRIDQIAKETPTKSWISLPVDDTALSKGFRDISYAELVTLVNAAAQWLRDHLSLPAEGFPAFAYIGPSDVRYPVFAVAAGKLGYQMIFPGPTVTPAGQKRILEQKACSTYVYSREQSALAQSLKELAPTLRTVCVPDLEELVKQASGEHVEYQKSWHEAKNDPWLVFHTSGTTDIALGLEDIGDTHAVHFQHSRSYQPIPLMHYVSMLITLSVTVFVDAVAIFGPTGRPPTPGLVKEILSYGHVDGATLVPALIDALCRDPESLDLLRQLKYIHYAGAPLSESSGKLLSPFVRVVPAIGSTEAGAYFTRLPNTTEDWDYIEFQPHTGAVMEHRVDDKYELVFVRDPRCRMQAIFERHPTLDRFETRDMFIEHPTKKNQWKIVGRFDDYIKFSSGYGMFVTPVESIIAEAPLVKNVLITGQGKSRPIILIEPVESAYETPKADIVTSLRPYLEQANSLCHEAVQLDARLVVLATEEKPWPRTLKNTIARAQTVQMYKSEIEDAYSNVYP